MENVSIWWCNHGVKLIYGLFPQSVNKYRLLMHGIKIPVKFIFELIKSIYVWVTLTKSGSYSYGRYMYYPQSCMVLKNKSDKQRVLMHGHQGWNVRHGLCHIYMIYVYIWVVHSFCLFCCLFIIVTTQFVALYEPCKPKPKPKPYTYDTRTTTPWQRSKFRYLDRSQSNKYAINMQIQTISVSK